MVEPAAPLQLPPSPPSVQVNGKRKLQDSSPIVISSSSSSSSSSSGGSEADGPSSSSDEEEEEEEEEDHEEEPEEVLSSEEDSDFEKKESKTPAVKKHAKESAKNGDRKPVAVPKGKGKKASAASSPETERAYSKLTHAQKMSVTDPPKNRPVNTPAFFKIPLYDYQMEGLAFLEKNVSSALIYEMGLGKTAMILAYICNYINNMRIAGNIDAANRPHLIILPKSVKNSWVGDFAKFVKESSAIDFLCIGDAKPNNSEREKIRNGSYNIVVASYEQVRTEFTNLIKHYKVFPKSFNFMKHKSIQLLRSAIVNWEKDHAKTGATFPLQIDEQGLATHTMGTEHWIFGHSWSTVVLDEAHRIRNAQTQGFVACCALQATHRIYSSGTPLHNKRDDLYNGFRFLRIPELISVKEWQNAGYSRTQNEHLAAIAKKWLKWKKKDDIEGIKIVPKRIFHYKCNFNNPDESAFYEYWREHLGKLADTAEASRGRDRDNASSVHLFAAIAKARQCCNAPGLVAYSPSHHPGIPVVDKSPDSWAFKNSTKMCALRAVIKDHIASSEKFVVFSSMVESLKIARQVIEDLGIKCEWLTGDQNQLQRAASIKRFKTDPTVRCFCISLKAGGEGLNLEEATRVIILDPWWDPQGMFQAMDRCHRVTSKSEVRVTFISIVGTIEDIMLNSAEAKQKMSDEIYNSVSFEDMLRKASGGGGSAAFGDTLAGNSRSMNTMIDISRNVKRNNTFAFREAGATITDEELQHDERAKLQKVLIQKASESATSNGCEGAPLLHLASVLMKHTKQISANCVLWDLRFGPDVSFKYGTSSLSQFAETQQPYNTYNRHNVTSAISAASDKKLNEGLFQDWTTLTEHVGNVARRITYIQDNLEGETILSEWHALRDSKLVLGAAPTAVLENAKQELDAIKRALKQSAVMNDAFLDICSQTPLIPIMVMNTSPSGEASPSEQQQLLSSIPHTIGSISRSIAVMEEAFENRKKDLIRTVEVITKNASLAPDQLATRKSEFKDKVSKYLTANTVTLTVFRTKRDLAIPTGITRIEMGRIFLAGAPNAKIEQVLKCQFNLAAMIPFVACQGYTVIHLNLAINANPCIVEYGTVTDVKDINDQYKNPLACITEDIGACEFILRNMSMLLYSQVSQLIVDCIKEERPLAAQLLMMSFFWSPPARADKSVDNGNPRVDVLRYAVYVKDANDVPKLVAYILIHLKIHYEDDMPERLMSELYVMGVEYAIRDITFSQMASVRSALLYLLERLAAQPSQTTSSSGSILPLSRLVHVVYPAYYNKAMKVFINTLDGSTGLASINKFEKQMVCARVKTWRISSMILPKTVRCLYGNTWKEKIVLGNSF